MEHQDVAFVVHMYILKLFGAIKVIIEFRIISKIACTKSTVWNINLFDKLNMQDIFDWHICVDLNYLSFFRKYAILLEFVTRSKPVNF